LNLASPIKRSATILACLLLAHTAAAEGDFARSLTPEEITGAGLAKLTPEEFAKLETLVQRFKAGAVAKAKEAAAAAAPAPAKSSSFVPAWVTALVTLEKAADDPHSSEVLETRLSRDFSGWTGRTTFAMENGQRWIQANSDNYVYSPTLKNPKVKIYPASMGTFWLEIEGVHQRCRVKPLRME